MKNCRDVIQTSEALYVGGICMEQKRFFSIPYMYEDMYEEALLQKVREIVSKDGAYLIAARRVTVKKKVKHHIFKFETLDGVEIDEKSEWNVSPIYDVLDFKVLHPLADPAILIIDTDKKNLKYRLNYYIDLVSKGMDSDEALKQVFS